MNFKKTFVFLIFWWALMFPNFFFNDAELTNIKNNNVSYKFWICDILTDN